MNDMVQAIAGLPAPAARMLAVEILLAEPEALGDDCLESCLYILREKLRAAAGSGEPPARQGRDDAGPNDRQRDHDQEQVCGAPDES